MRRNSPSCATRCSGHQRAEFQGLRPGKHVRLHLVCLILFIGILLLCICFSRLSRCLSQGMGRERLQSGVYNVQLLSIGTCVIFIWWYLLLDLLQILGPTVLLEQLGALLALNHFI
jgi:uncharacterized membrane protein YidH (DUF202 family)